MVLRHWPPQHWPPRLQVQLPLPGKWGGTCTCWDTFVWFSDGLITWLGGPFKNRIFFTTEHIIFVQFPDHHLKTRPFDNWSCLDHLNTRLVWYSDGYRMHYERRYFEYNYQSGHGFSSVHSLAQLVGFVDEEDTSASTVQSLLNFCLGLAKVFASQVQP